MREGAPQEKEVACAEDLGQKSHGRFQDPKEGHVSAAVSPGGQAEARHVGKSQTLFRDLGFYPKALRSPWKM